jgi:hypothetical protein
VSSKETLNNKYYYNQNYWVFELFPLFGILGTRKHDISETGSVSIEGGKTPTLLDP